MIHTARNHAKFKRLVRRLRPLMDSAFVDPETVAVGLLERLWHATITSAMRGDIGRIDDETLAELLGWFGPPEDLVGILLDCGWLDASDEHRLIVHDWHDHAPRHVKGNITRMGGFVSQNSEPRPNHEAPPQGPAPGATPKGPPQGMGAPNVTKPNQTKPNETDKAKRPSSRTESKTVDAFGSWWAAYPKRVGKKTAMKAFAEAIKSVGSRDGPSGDDPHGWLLERTEAFARSDKGRGKYCPNPATWLNQGRYDDDQSAWTEAGGIGPGQKYTAPADGQSTSAKDDGF